MFEMTFIKLFMYYSIKTDPICLFFIFCVTYGGINTKTPVLVEMESYLFESYNSLCDNYKETIISLHSGVL